jgi:hypothetical protein
MRSFVVGVALMATLATVEARAGVRETAPDAAPAVDERGVHEVRHDVTVRLEDGVAHFRVTRVLTSDGDGPTEGNVWFRLPEGGAVTGFRVGDAGRLIEGRIGDATQVEARYLDLRGSGSATPCTIAMLRWDGLGAVGLRVFPVYPGDELHVQLGVVAPLRYAGGVLRCSYPRAAAGEPAPTITVDAGGSGARAQVSLPLDPDDPESEPYEITAPPPRFTDLATRFARLDLGDDRHVTRIELAVAPRLGEIPKAPRLVFVVDRSWSQREEGVAAELQIVRGVLAHVPDARVEVVVFDRRAERLAGTLVPAGDVADLLEVAGRKGRLAPRNGSDPLVGLRAAADALGEGKGPARVILLTDRVFPFAWEPRRAAAALGALPQGTIVHAVERTGGGGGDLEEWRAEGDDLTPLVAAFGGQVLAIAGDSEDPAALAEVTLGLVRPIRIDDVEVRGFPDAPTPIAEGDGWTFMALLETRVDKLVVRGKIWGRTVELALAPDRALGDALPALVFGDGIHDDLSPTEASQVGIAAGVVTPETSYLAAEPDAEPSTIGFEEVGGGIGISSSCGGTRCGGVGCHVGRAAAIDGEAPRVWLADATAEGFAACAAGGAPLSGTLAVEATGDEVVAVTVTGPGGAVARCAEEVVWNLRLPEDLFYGHKRYELVLGAEAPVEAEITRVL